MPVYTKKGDYGKTTIYKKYGEKALELSKASPLIDAIGTIDEANSSMGILTSEINDKSVIFKTSIKHLQLLSELKEIQRDFFTIGAILAGADIKLSRRRIKKLEDGIDTMERKLPKLTGFILPGGSTFSAKLMYTRALVRRAERKIVYLSESFKIKEQDYIFAYVNRLSDYLFILARWVNFKDGFQETKWKTR